MRRPQGAYVVGEAAANAEARMEAPPAGAVILVSGSDATWRRDVATALRASGATVRVASQAAERQKALADGRVTCGVVDDVTPGTSSSAPAWDEALRIIYRVAGETGEQTAARVLAGGTAQGTTSA